MSLPILSSQFFEKHSPDLGFFSKWQSLFHWSDRILPIYEWQDVLYVGCLQPPSNFPQTNQKVVFILCAPDALRKVWDEFEGAVVAPEIAIDTVADDLAEFKLDLGAAPATETPMAAELELPDLEPVETPSATASEPAAPIESSSEFSLELNLEEPVASASTPEPEPSVNAAPTAPATPDAVAEIKPRQDDSPAALLEDAPGEDEVGDRSIHTSAVDDGEELLDLSGGLPPQAPVVSTTTNAASSPLISLQPLDAKTETKTTKAKGEKESAEENTPVDAILATTEKRATPAKSEVLMGNSSVTMASVQALNNVPAEKLEPWIEKLFTDISSQYKKAMILLKSGDQVKPWKWNAQFQPSTPAVTSISLLQASPFRIVHRTHKPFHGYVIMNDINEKFFAQWNEGKLPQHLTITPIMIEDHVIGMLLAIGEKSADTKACLQMMETLAGNVAKQIQASKGKAA